MLGIFYKKSAIGDVLVKDKTEIISNNNHTHISNSIRDDFPIFDKYKKRENHNLIYLDNASTSQMPITVSDKISEYNLEYKSNIYRGQYKNAIWSTREEENSRRLVSDFINANNPDDIIWTFGATDSANKLSLILEKYIKWDKDSEIYVSEYSHHSDFVVLQELAKKMNAKLIFDINQVSKNTKIVSHPLVSNVTGEIFNIANISKIAKSVGAFVISDVTAAAGHIKINVQELGVDAIYFSGHKMLAATGVGVLYINRDISRKMPPAFYGGGIVANVSKNKTIYRSDNQLFEPGTQNISGILSLGEAINYINNIGIDNIRAQDEYLLSYLLQELEILNIKYNNIIKLYTAENIHNNVGTVSLVINNIHSHDVSEILANRHICVRAGHHCAELFMKKCNEISMLRISLYFYNNIEDIDETILAIEDAINTFNK